MRESISDSKDIYTRLSLTGNAATPPAILERLAKDPDEILARNASQALERHAKRMKESNTNDRVITR